MGGGTRLAFNLSKKYGIFMPPDLRRLVDLALREGAAVKCFPFGGRIKERYIRPLGGTPLISVKRGLPEPEFKYMVAFGLWHHLTGCQEAAYIEGYTVDDGDAGRFAALLLAPPLSLPAAWPEMAKDELSLALGIPPRLADIRLKMEKEMDRLLPLGSR